jgi:hypothetical protein
VHVERHPLNEFYAVPSYLLRLDDGARWVVVWGDHLLLVLAYIEIDGIPGTLGGLFSDRSAALRTGHGNLHCRTQAVIGGTRGGVASAVGHEHRARGPMLEAIVAEVEETIERAAELLRSQGIQVEVNPLRNYSFQKRFYDWEQRER